MKFIADCMLGKLAKWLRVLGYDTLYAQQNSAAAILLTAQSQERILLTRNTKLFAKIPPPAGLFITSDHVAEQLQQVVGALHLEIAAHLLTRCLLCNAELERIAKSAAASAAPDFIYHTHHDFARCPRCGRIYWPGSHHHRMAERIRQLQHSVLARFS